MRNSFLARLFLAALPMAWPVAAQTSYYKADNNLSLDQPASWTNNNGSTPQSSDWAIWDAHVATPANCTNENIGSSASWGGIRVLNPAAAITITNTGKTLTLGSLGIDMNESNTTVDFYENVPLTIPAGAPQSWNIAPGRTLNFGIGTGSSIQISSDLTINGVVRLNAKDFRIGVSGPMTLTITNANTLLDFSAGALSLSVGYGNDCTVNQNAGVVNLLKNSTSTGALLLGASGSGITGTYNLNGGVLQDTNPATADYLSIGDANADVGVLNVNGGVVNVPQFQIGNKGYGYVNLTNGSIITGAGPKGNDFIVNKGSSSLGGWLNVYGGMLTVLGHNLVVGKGGNSSFANSANVYLTGTGIINVDGTVQIPGGSAWPGNVTMDGGAMNASNGVVLLASGSGSGTFNLNGGVLTTPGVSVGSGTGAGTFNFNGGTLRAGGNNDNFIPNTNSLTVNILAGGALVDSAGFAVTVPAALLNGTGGSMDGGLTKLGAGTLTLAGANSYTGPTLIGSGALALTTTNLNGGAIVVSNHATLHLALARANDTLATSTLTLGASSSDTTTVEFDLGAFGTPSRPPIYATNLVANGTILVNVFAATNLSPGVIPLIHYAAGAGAPVVKLNFAQGVGGYLTNDTAVQTVELVAQILPPVIWRALVDTNWDTTTPNWVSTVNGATTLFANGAGAQFDDSASNSLVNLTAPLSPTTVLVSNNVLNYTFAGPGKITGSTALLKEGAGALTLALTNANDYTGDTVLSNGLVLLGAAEQIPDGVGKGDVVLEGRWDLAGFNETINGLNGVNGVIDNSGASPVTLTVGANGDGGVFAGLITNSGASLMLNKTGGHLTLLAGNGYSGGTLNENGELTLASEQSIGSGPLTLNGGTLDWTTGSAHTLTVPVTLGGNVTFGSPTNANGLLTVAGPVNLSAGTRSLICNEDVWLPAGVTNGAIANKDGPGTLLLQNSTFQVPGTPMRVSDGTWIMDHDTIIENGSNIRVQSGTDQGLARLVVTNGGALIISNTASANFRVGATDVSGGAGCTNILDVAGLVRIIPTGTADALLLGGSSSAVDAEDDVNLLPGGVLEVHQIKASAAGPITALNFNGGTLRANKDDFASAFLQGLTAVNVLDGGAIIDTAGFNITISQALLQAGTGLGGLIKNGAGILFLNGVNTYTGPTLVNAGSLGGTGSLNSPVTVASGASLMAGASLASLGTLTINNSVTFNAGSSAVMKITKTGGLTASDNLAGVTAMNYGGTLMVVTNAGMTDTLAAGDTFTLFSAASYHGSFEGYQLPVLPAGLAWDTSHLASDGTLRVVTAPLAPPVFTSVTLRGGNLILSGSGGAANSTYRVLASTNAALPLSNWPVIATNNFDAAGGFSFTNLVNSTNAVQFFNIVTP